MTRQRSTWSDSSGGTPREATTSRRADIYNMNQDHPQPSPVEYENGSPDDWAETPTSNKNVDQDYEGGHVRRNELNFGEFRDDTFNHKDSDHWNDGKGKYDNAREAAARKASAAERVARAVLRTSDDKLLEEQASDFMSLPDPVLAATLRRLDKVSPDSLPKDRKYKRAMACCKLAARLLPEKTTEQEVERLASVLMGIDDPTLREILKTVAATTVAHDAPGETEEEERKEKEEKAAGAKNDMPPTQEPGAPKVEGKKDAGGDDTSCMTAEDLALLDSMLSEEAGPPAAVAPIVAPPAAAAPVSDLTDLFAPPPAMMAPPVAGPPMAAAASELPDIRFDDEDDDGAPQVAAGGVGDAELDALFDDHPEVIAQREQQAAAREQAAREAGYSSATRTASAGAKRIGNVQVSRNDPSTELESLWDRPGA